MASNISAKLYTAHLLILNLYHMYIINGAYIINHTKLHDNKENTHSYVLHILYEK